MTVVASILSTQDCVRLRNEWRETLQGSLYLDCEKLESQVQALASQLIPQPFKGPDGQYYRLSVDHFGWVNVENPTLQPVPLYSVVMFGTEKYKGIAWEDIASIPLWFAAMGLNMLVRINSELIMFASQNVQQTHMKIIHTYLISWLDFFDHIAQVNDENIFIIARTLMKDYVLGGQDASMLIEHLVLAENIINLGESKL